MNTSELLSELQSRGISLEDRGDTLHVEGPKGTLTPELRDVLVEQKSELLAAIRDHGGYASFPCPSCAWPLPMLRKPRFCLACTWSES